MNKLLIVVAALVSIYGCNWQSESHYFGQTPPGDSAIVFASGIISIEGRKERSLTISPEGNEIFFCQAGFPNSMIYHMVRTDSGWSSPKLFKLLEDDWATEPSLSPDGKTLYFSSSRGKSEIKDYHLWSSTKGTHGWSAPESLFDMDGSSIWEFHPSVTNNGATYFCWWDPSVFRGAIYLAKPDSEIAKLDTPFNNHVDPFIAPDESYLITKSIRPEGYGGHDVYISYKMKDGSWTRPYNLGSSINTSEHDDVGDISPDGKYMFFTRNNDIYWISTNGIFKPYVYNPIPEIKLQLGQEVEWQLPENLFKDVNDRALDYTMDFIQVDWLKFDKEEMRIVGTPRQIGEYQIKLTASDKNKNMAVERIKIIVKT